MQITVQAAAELLLSQDNIVILAHYRPDGDTLGSCFGLLYALEARGKTARVECADGVPARYRAAIGAENVKQKEFTPRFVVACDVASRGMLGALEEAYPKIDLCIDHHKSNTGFAKRTLLDASAPAAAQVIYEVLCAMGTAISVPIAAALYTGITTDTGCFRFSNVTAATHRTAAALIDAGAPHYEINKQMFDTKSRGRVEVEKAAMDSLEYFCGGRCAVMTLPAGIAAQFGIGESDLDGLSSFPRRIEGVLCGVTLRGQTDGSVRVSLRCGAPTDASRICAAFGGGGHTAAAGCTVHGTLAEVKQLLLEAVTRELQECGA